MEFEQFEQQMPPEAHLTSDLAGLVEEWEELGIDPDDFVKCGVCHKYFVDQQGNSIACDCDLKE
jgi:hypothetical protein